MVLIVSFDEIKYVCDPVSSKEMLRFEEGGGGGGGVGVVAKRQLSCLLLQAGCSHYSRNAPLLNTEENHLLPDWQYIST